MAKMGPETKLVNKMRKAAQEEFGSRLVIIKQHGNSFTEVGVSDLLCVLDGHFIAVEVKAPESYGNSVERACLEGATVKQKVFLKRVREAGGTAFVSASVDRFLETLRQVSKTT